MLTISHTWGIDSKKFDWEKMELGFNAQFTFVSGNSQTDFWVQNTSGKLLHIKDKKIASATTPPLTVQFISTNYYKLSKNEFLCAVVTPKWEGEIYKITNNVWSKYNIELFAPVRFFYKTENNILYLTGDFGLLLTLKNNRWIIIDTPFKSHIITTLIKKNKLYIATRNDGTIIFDGKTFTVKLKKSRYREIKDLKFINTTLYALTINNRVIKYTGSTEHEITDNETIKYFRSTNSTQFGFVERNIIFENKAIKIAFPQNYNIAIQTGGLRNIKVLADSSILLLSNDGNIFISNPTTENCFTNLAQIYRIDDLPNSYNNGTQFFDANNDGIVDLLILNRNYGNYLSLYRGVENSAFADITSISNLPTKENKTLFFAISDFNKDELSDIVLELQTDYLHKLVLYQNLGNFKFENVKEITLPKYFQTMGIRNLLAFDYDKDGDEDIVVTSYYGNGDNPGYVLIYKNDYWGNFNQIDSTLKPITRHWNEKIIFADVNNNDTLDILNTVLWNNDHLFFGTDTCYAEKNFEYLPRQKMTETNNAFFSDFDNDGDLDLFTTARNDFVRAYSNNGEGKFTEKTSELFNESFLDNSKLKSIGSLNFGDFDNDTFTDIFISVHSTDTNYITIFKNNKGKSFDETPINFDNKNNYCRYTTISDFDKDGDLDIYGGTKKHNFFLVNRLDTKNFLEIKLNGIIASSQALGSKIWIYKDGKLNIDTALIGYKELGTARIRKNGGNDFILHFGLGNITQCDIKVKFSSGRVITLTNVNAGSILNINELPFLYAVIYKLPGNIYRFVSKTENQLYILLILFSHLILVFGLWYGSSKLNWTTKPTLIFTVLNISLFWISLYLASLSTNRAIQFLFPLALTVFVTTIPLGIYYWANKSGRKNLHAYNDKLLELAMSFSHGEWALRNLNSIILLCENSPINWEDNSEFNSKLSIRLNTFSDMTIAAINEIISYEKQIGNYSEEVKNLEIISTETIGIINDFNAETSQLPLAKITENLTAIRHNIKELRNIIYARFSANPTEVINNLITNFESSLTDNSITILKQKQYLQEIPVLIKNYELGNILDNFLQNSIRFMKSSKEKAITILLYKESPKIILEFSNTGVPIPKDKWELIFTQGYSEAESTGQGLFTAREMLKKYGGRIYISNSNSNQTTFKIELNEGTTLD